MIAVRRAGSSTKMTTASSVGSDADDAGSTARRRCSSIGPQNEKNCSIAVGVATWLIFRTRTERDKASGGGNGALAMVEKHRWGS